MTDLKTVNDHPTAVIQPSIDTLREIGELDDVDGLLKAQYKIRAYEKDHDVTFAALDNETLAAIRAEYNGGAITQYAGFIGLVVDLLGLDDE